MTDRTTKSIEIIDYAIKNKISIKKATSFFGFNETYVKNAKADLIERFEKGRIEQDELNIFLSKYKEYVDSKTNQIKLSPPKQEDLLSNNQLTSNDNFLSENTEDFEAYCKKNNINSKDIITYWHKSKQYSIYLRNNQERLNQQFEILKDLLKQETKPVSKERKDVLLNNNDNCAVINIFDLHIDKKAYDSSEDGIEGVLRVKNEIKRGFDEILQSTLIHKPNTIIFPIGNDLLNSNGFSNATVKGTPQINLVEQDAAFRQALELCKYMIDRITQETTAKVLIPIVLGNHDKHSSFYLGVCLEVMYHNNLQIEINNEIKDDRKYYIFEDILFAFMHGDKYLNKIAQLPMIVMQENRNRLSETKFTQCYLGDQHHKMEFKFFRTKDYPGCNVSFLRGTSVTDGWHQDNGYIGVPRTIEAFIWKKGKGQIANYSLNL